MFILYFFLTIICILCLIYIGIIIAQRHKYKGGTGTPRGSKKESNPMNIVDEVNTLLETNTQVGIDDTTKQQNSKQIDLINQRLENFTGNSKESEDELDGLIHEINSQEGVLSIKISKLLELNNTLLQENNNLKYKLEHTTILDKEPIMDKITKNETQIKIIDKHLEEYIKKDIETKRKININIKNIL